MLDWTKLKSLVMATVLMRQPRPVPLDEPVAETGSFISASCEDSLALSPQLTQELQVGRQFTDIRNVVEIVAAYGDYVYFKPIKVIEDPDCEFMRTYAFLAMHTPVPEPILH